MEKEKRLIDANDVYSLFSQNGMARLHVADIDAIPRVDAVEVVRCKDCVNYCGFEHCKNGICDVDSVSKRAVYPDDFCSYGERKDNDSTRS